MYFTTAVGERISNESILLVQLTISRKVYFMYLKAFLIKFKRAIVTYFSFWCCNKNWKAYRRQLHRLYYSSSFCENGTTSSARLLSYLPTLLDKYEAIAIKQIERSPDSFSRNSHTGALRLQHFFYFAICRREIKASVSCNSSDLTLTVAEIFTRSRIGRRCGIAGMRHRRTCRKKETHGAAVFVYPLTC